MLCGMEQIVSQTASSLGPLMLLLGAIFGILIVLALVLRLRTRSSSTNTRKKGPAQIQTGDLISILGRTYSVLDEASLPFLESQASLYQLKTDDATGRMILCPKPLTAIHFPAHSQWSEPGAPPQTIHRSGTTYDQALTTQQIRQGLRITGYRCCDLWLLLEQDNTHTTLWRGKAIPAEGVSIVE